MDKQDAPKHGEDDSSKVAEASLDKVRQLLFGQDDRYLAPSVDKQVRQSVSGVVSEALIERERKDGSVNKILVPLVERSIDRSIEVNRDKIVGSLYPLVGSLVRKAVSAFLVDFVEKTNNIIESSFSVRGAMWRFRAWQAGIRYSDYVAAQIYQYKIDQLLIIHRETGTLLVSVAADESKAQDADLLSSMLVAINDFVADAITQSASSESSLHEVKTDAVTLQIKVGPEAILVAAVVGKLPPDVQVKLQTTLEEFHHFYNQPLAAYEGDNSEFQSAQGVLIDCLVSDKREAYRKPAGWKKIPVWLLLLALVGFGCVQVYQ
ncbi:MAG TPA: flagellar motor protein MotB, partial [Alteromonas sp.]|nr:flagellar motor protein MotB [Alteromonas sp.]